MDDPNERTGVFKLPKQAIQQKTDESAWIEVLQGPESGRKVALSRNHPLIIGRGVEADLRIEDTNLSRRHSEIRFVNGDYQLVDLKSTNGTYVNQVRVADCILHDGDLIQSGSSLFRFRLVRVVS